jgi:hypothetical protein
LRGEVLGLTAAQAEKGTKQGRHGDGTGLYLWVVRARRSSGCSATCETARCAEMELVPAVGREAVSLSKARERALELRAVVREG